MKILLLLIFCLTCSFVVITDVSAQDRHKVDSLLQELNLTKPDTNRAKILFTLTWENMKGRSTETARKYADSAMALCVQLDFEKGVALVNYYYGVMGRLEGNYKEALDHFEAYNSFFAKRGDSVRLAHSLYQMAVIHRLRGDYQQSLDTYLKILRIYEVINNTYSIATTLNSIGIIYKDLGKDDEALEHYHRALEIFRDQDAKIDMADCLNNIGNIYAIGKKYEKAIQFYNQSKDLNLILDNQWGVAYQLSNAGRVYSNLEQYEKAIAMLQESLRIRLELGQKKEIVQSYCDVAETMFKTKKYDQAISYFQKSLVMAEDIGAVPELQRAFLGLSEISAKKGRFQKAYEYYKSYTKAKDSLLNESSIKQINELQAKYEYEKKEKEIALITKEQEAQKTELLQERNLKNIFVFGILLLCILMIFLITGYKSKLKNKEALAKKNDEINFRKIKEMEKNQKLYALNAMLNGQEAERKRIAQDLHDGLGVLLSGVQMNFNAIKDKVNKILELEMYHKADQLLNEASAEVRKIAHNMMPGTLLKLGLVPAIKDLCDNINRTTAVNIEFHSFDLKERLTESTEVAVYRLVQEVLNNIVKHAGAQGVLVQFSKDESGLNITIEDDGVGFNVSAARSKGGMGLRNLESRVKYLNGELQIISGEGNGTAVIVDIPLMATEPETI